MERSSKKARTQGKDQVTDFDKKGQPVKEALFGDVDGLDDEDEQEAESRIKCSIDNDGPSIEKKQPRLEELDGGDSKKKEKLKCASASGDEEPKGFDQ